MRRVTALLLALALGVSLAACGKDDTEKKDEPKLDGNTTTQPGTTPDGGANQPADDANTPAQDDVAGGSTNGTVDKPITTAPPASKPAGGSGTASTGGGNNNSAGAGGTATTKPEVKPETKPEAKPETKPEPAKPTLAQAQGYVGSSVSSLKSALGAPNSTSYSPSCMGEGEDGIWSYDGFTVYTYRENGNETVEDVQ